MSSIEKFQKELINLSKEIRMNKELTNEKIERLEHLFKIGGVSEYTVESIYRNCGFNSWNEYVISKKSFIPEKASNVNCVDQKIQVVVSNILNVTSSMSTV